MFTGQIYDRANELYGIGVAKEEAMIELNQLREKLVEEDRNFLLDAGYSEQSVDAETKDFGKKLEQYTTEVVNELYC